MWRRGTHRRSARNAPAAVGVVLGALSALSVALPFASPLSAATVAGGATVSTTVAPTASTTTTVPVAAPTTSTTAPGLGSGTITAPQHVASQPNLNALVPHIEALLGSGVQYQQSNGAAAPAGAPGVPSFLTSSGGPYLYDRQGRVVLLHGVNVVYKHAPYIAYPDPGHPWDFSASDAREMRALGF